MIYVSHQMWLAVGSMKLVEVIPGGEQGSQKKPIAVIQVTVARGSGQAIKNAYPLKVVMYPQGMHILV